MQETSNLLNLEGEVFQVDAKDYKTMMIALDGMRLTSKRVTTVAEFLQTFEKGGLLTNNIKVTPEKLKGLTVEKGELKMTLNYRKMLEFGAPDELGFSNADVLNNILIYIEKKWFFHRTEKPMTPFKAIVPYMLALLAALYITGFTIYINSVGGTYRTAIFMVLLVKLSEKIGFIPTILLGLLSSVLIIRALWKAFKNPPVEVRLESIS